MAELICDDGPGEWRAGLVKDDEIVELHIQRWNAAIAGETGIARIATKDAQGAILITEDGTELRTRRGASVPEGTSLPYQILRAALAEPGRSKRAEAIILDAPAAHQTRESLWQEKLQALAASRQSPGPIDQALDVALAGEVVVGDALISFQRTKAGLIFDVDGVGDPFQLNLTAAGEIARLLRLYQVGGMAIIDFIGVDSRAARQAVDAAFDAAAARDPRPYERSAMNGFGGMQIVRRRTGPSVLDQLFGTNIASPCDETHALWLLRTAARSSGFGARVVTTRPRIAAVIEEEAQRDARQAVERATGAPLQIIADTSILGYGHVHVSQG